MENISFLNVQKTFDIVKIFKGYVSKGIHYLFKKQKVLPVFTKSGFFLLLLSLHSGLYLSRVIY
jgi:hypothetical protein